MATVVSRKYFHSKSPFSIRSFRAANGLSFLVIMHLWCPDSWTSLLLIVAIETTEEPNDRDLVTLKDCLFGDDVVYNLACLLDNKGKAMPKFARLNGGISPGCRTARPSVLSTAETTCGLCSEAVAVPRGFDHQACGRHRGTRSISSFASLRENEEPQESGQAKGRHAADGHHAADWKRPAKRRCSWPTRPHSSASSIWFYQATSGARPAHGAAGRGIGSRLAWTLVVLAVVLGIRVQRPRGRPFVMGVGVGDASPACCLAARRRGGASNFLEQGGGSHSHRAGGPRTNGPSNRFPILVRPSQPTSFRPESVAAREDRLADRAGVVFLFWLRAQPPSSSVEPPKSPRSIAGS